ncbi:MAG: Trp family transcriptional regulator [Patescibacteria group bacterium]
MKKKNATEISKILVKIRTPKQAAEFLRDFLTEKEVNSLAERWQIVKMIMKGVAHRKISKTLKVSISKITRGSRAVQKSRGGFKNFITK